MQSLNVSNCVFDGYGVGFTTGVAAQRVSFTDCSFSGNRVAMIYDSQDDPNIHYTIQFEPFADGPVPTEKRSPGSLKALFR